MSVDTHSALPPSMIESVAAPADGDHDFFEATWTETIGTVIATTIAVIFVSFIAVLMVLA